MARSVPELRSGTTGAMPAELRHLMQDARLRLRLRPRLRLRLRLRVHQLSAATTCR
jgi:hypothetical protein